MVFSSLVFLFVFLPIMLIGYYLIKDEYKNYFLLLGSLFFYAWGEPIYIFLMLISILFNYYFGIMVSGHHNKTRKTWLIVSVIFNISLLGLFKYTGFFISTINSALNLDFPIPSISLPLGISFFTFQALSYVIDVYRNNAKVQKNLFTLALYISLFPQLVAGPIVRYQTIANQITKRNHSLEYFAEGIEKFIIGLSKKVLISNPLGSAVDTIFLIPPDEISLLTSWIGIISYTLQIYFDFSGYSDMAIGLSKMFGFKFPENFNYPYIAESATEFWRRWHISLGTWFKDYVYIPLGGNRVKPTRAYFNLLVVWMLTGFWHGASLSFIAWGLYFGIFISLEKAFLLKLLSKVYKPIRHIYLLLVIIISWVFFRAYSISYGFDYLKTMFSLNNTPIYDNLSYIYINDLGFTILLGIIFSVPTVKWIKNKILLKKPTAFENTLTYALESSLYSLLFFLVILQLVNSSYNPFLYFRF